MAAVRDLEHRLHVGGGAYVAQVCSPDPHSAAPVRTGDADVAIIITCPADEHSDFNHDDPEFLARRVVVDISTRTPQVPEAELEAFFNDVVEWMCEHRRIAAEAAHED